MSCSHCEKKTHILFVLDTSGSMGSCKEDAIGSFNTQVETLRKNAKDLGATDVSLVLFGLGFPSPIQVLQRAISLDSVALLNNETYNPQGNTPMRDGIGQAISLGEMLDTKGDNEAFLLVCITDGEENASKEWTAKALAQKIEQLRGTSRWTFQVLGANIDFSKVSDFGIDRTEFSSYNQMNMKASIGALSGSLAGYAGTRSRNLTSSQGLSVPDTK